MRHRPRSWLLSTEMARRMYILFTIQSLQRGISHRSCSQKGHLGRWVVGWGVVLGGWHWHWEPSPSPVWIPYSAWCWWDFETAGSAGPFLWTMIDCWKHYHQETRECAKVVQLTDGPIVCQNPLRKLPLLWTMIDFLSNTTLHSLNSGEDAQRWSYSLMDLPGQGRVPRPN